MNILMGEIPDGVYADDLASNPDTNKRSYSSSEIRSHASTFADLYSNLSVIYGDKFATTVGVGSITKWETDYFISKQDSSQPLETRRQNLLTKIRATGGISYTYLNTLIHSVLDPLGLTFDLFVYCGMPDGAWILDISALGLDTFLSIEDPLLGARRDLTPLDCTLNYAAAGLTALQLADIQTTAYTYEVKIYGHASPATLSTLGQLLTQSEKGGSTHIITNDAQNPALIGGSVFDMGLAGNGLIDSFDFGNGLPASTFDLWDFNL